MAKNKKVIQDSKSWDDEGLFNLILEILESSDRSESKPEFFRKVLASLFGLVSCDLITIRVGRSDDLERFQASLDTSGEYSFQNIKEAANSPSKDSKGSENGLIPQPIQDDFWPSKPFLWPEDGSCAEETPHSKYWFDWLSSQGAGMGLTRALIQPITHNQSLNGIIAFGYARPGHPSLEECRYGSRIAPFIGLSLANWHNFASLRERIKELSCLYGLSQLLDPPGKSIEEVLEETVQLLPQAWLYAGEASAAIRYDGKEYLSYPYASGEQNQTADLKVNGKIVGEVVVSYATAKPILDEGPFLAEERKLLDNVARQISQYIERSRYEEEKAEILDKLRHADRLAMIGRLAASMAHEINEPLTSILGFAQLAEKHPDLPPQVADDIGKVVATSLHMREIVRKTLIYSRKMPPKESLLDLNSAIREAVDLFGWLCRKEGIATIFEPSDQPLPLLVDPGQIRQVITNLVVNAIQAMPHSGELKIKTDGDPQWIWFSVADTGQGMTKEVRDKMFIPFFSTKETGKGTGLGLSVVKEIVTEQGGAIQVETGPGRGTEIVVKFPRSQDPSEKC